MAYMIKTKIMENQCVPIIFGQLFWNMPCHIVVDLSKVLIHIFSSILSRCTHASLTATKKLDVPSARSKLSGNNFIHVSSPYITILPVPFAFIWASHVSWAASVEEVSDSAKLRITSRKDGTEPVVIALIRGIVIVGDAACAVNGMAEPSLINLQESISIILSGIQYFHTFE
jgi:hypothetical protein